MESAFLSCRTALINHPAAVFSPRQTRRESCFSATLKTRGRKRYRYAETCSVFRMHFHKFACGIIFHDAKKGEGGEREKKRAKEKKGIYGTQSPSMVLSVAPINFYDINGGAAMYLIDSVISERMHAQARDISRKASIGERIALKFTLVGSYLRKGERGEGKQ